MEKHDEEITGSEYKRGYADGLKATAEKAAKLKEDYDKDIERAYQHGMEDLKDSMLAIDKWSSDHKVKVFHGDIGAISILKNHTGSYIVNEVRKYKEQKAQEIKVGDEVTYCNDTGVVVRIEDGYDKCFVMGSNGGWFIRTDRDKVRLTGRHFPQIVEVLDALKGGE